jgi:hypothetical protein
MKRLSSIGLIGVALAITLITWIGSRWYDNRYPTWREEVQLSDGRIVVVKQKHQYYENYGTSQSWVTFSLPEMGGEQTWHSYLKPMRIDVADGKVYAFGRPRGDGQVQFYVYPLHYLVAFKWSGLSFERIPFMNVPEQIRSSENVFPCVPANRDVVLNWKQKENNWCPPSDSKGLLVRNFDLNSYDTLAQEYARRAGGKTITE